MTKKPMPYGHILKQAHEVRSSTRGGATLFYHTGSLALIDIEI